MANYLGKRRSEMLMAWLETATPDQWHQVADGWNWGSGEDPLRWIVSQPDCDKATALLIFWRGEPGYYWSGARDKAGWKASGKFFPEDLYDMLTGIVARWRAGGFTRSEIDYLSEGGDESDVGSSANHPALAISPDMGRDLAGRVVTGCHADGFEEGIPLSIVAATMGE
jgi:hypothetical protein